MESLEGLAIMYLSLPMSPLSIPVVGCCQLVDKRLTLKFPTSKIAFELPKQLEHPSRFGEQKVVQEFKMAGPKGEMKVTLSYNPSLDAFIGCGTGMITNFKYLTFVLSRPGSFLAKTQIIWILTFFGFMSFVLIQFRFHIPNVFLHHIYTLRLTFDLEHQKSMTGLHFSECL